MSDIGNSQWWYHKYTEMNESNTHTTAISNNYIIEIISVYKWLEDYLFKDKLWYYLQEIHIHWQTSTCIYAYRVLDILGRDMRLYNMIPASTIERTLFVPLSLLSLSCWLAPGNSELCSSSLYFYLLSMVMRGIAICVPVCVSPMCASVSARKQPNI